MGSGSVYNKHSRLIKLKEIRYSISSSYILKKRIPEKAVRVYGGISEQARRQRKACRAVGCRAGLAS